MLTCALAASDSPAVVAMLARACVAAFTSHRSQRPGSLRRCPVRRFPACTRAVQPASSLFALAQPTPKLSVPVVAAGGQKQIPWVAKDKTIKQVEAVLNIVATDMSESPLYHSPPDGAAPRAEKKPKAKSKAKAKGQTGARATRARPKLAAGPEVAQTSLLPESLEPFREDGTPTAWLDDAVALVERAVLLGQHQSSDVSEHLKVFIVSICLEFAFCRSVVYDGRLYKKWTSLRSDLLKLPGTLDKKVMGMQGESTTPADLAKRLLDAVVRSAATEAEAEDSRDDGPSGPSLNSGEAAAAARIDATALEALQAFISKSPASVPPQFHPAKQAMSMALSRQLAQLPCRGVGGRASLTLTEFLAVAATAVFEEVNAEWVQAVHKAYGVVKSTCQVPEYLRGAFPDVASIVFFLSLRSCYTLHLVAAGK